MRWLFTSYGEDLAMRDNDRCRSVIRSLWYQERWGQTVQIVDTQDTKHKFENTMRGYRMATSITGGITGEGGDYLILDDPHNALQAESEVERAKVKDFVDRAWSSRINNPKTVVKGVIMQRLHPEDVTAHLLAKEAGWETLILPAEYVPTTRVWWNGKKDPRKEAGELLWPERFGAPEIAVVKRDSEYAYEAQWQQNPKGRAGGMFNVATMRLNEVGRPPDNRYMVWSWDFASSTKKDAKRTSGFCVSKDVHGHYYIEVGKVGKWAPEQRNTIIKNIADMAIYANKRILAEDQPAAAGEDFKINLTKLLAPHLVEWIDPKGDKAVRADSFAAHCNLGLVHVVNNGTWDVELLYSELQSFPTGEYKDQVDSLSQAFNWLALIDYVNVGYEDQKRTPQDWRDTLPLSGWQDDLDSMTRAQGASDGQPF